MFLKEINAISLVNDVADRLFDNITASNYGCYDKSFTATLRAVLYERLPTSERLNLSLVPVCYDIDAISFTPNEVAKGIADSIRQQDITHSYTIYIVYPQDKHIGNQLLDIVRANFGEGKRYFKDYAIQEDLRIFYIKKLNGLFYINCSNTLIFLDYLDISRFHALQMMIPKYLPQLFINNPLSSMESELLKSLGAKNPDGYTRLIETFAQQLDIRSEIIRTRLKGFETAYERERVQQVTECIETYQIEFQHLLSDFRDKLNAIQTQQIILAGLQCKIDDDKSEIMDYFICNKNLSIIKVVGTVLEFVVHGYADIYDEDAFDTYAGNQNSFLYNRIGSVPRDSMERFYRAVFNSGVFKLRICAAYKADMRNSITPFKGYIFPPESQTYLPNPHIQHHGCVGGYLLRFVEYMQNHDYVGAIDQAAVSARNLNFHDSTVMSTFANTLVHTPIKCIEDVKGNLMTPSEAIKKLEEVEKCQNQSA